jgi:hypothetical protein
LGVELQGGRHILYPHDRHEFHMIYFDDGCEYRDKNQQERS